MSFAIRRATEISVIAASFILGVLIHGAAQAGPGHSGPHGNTGRQTIEQMREMHRGHTHAHDFKAMDEMTPEQGERMIKLMRDIGLALPRQCQRKIA